MSNILSLVRAVATRALGAHSPALDGVVDDTMAEVLHALREKLVSTSDLRAFAKQTTKVVATRAFASERRTAVLGTGRQSTIAATRNISRDLESARLAELTRLLAEYQRSAALRRAAMLSARGELVFAA